MAMQVKDIINVKNLTVSAKAAVTSAVYVVIGVILSIIVGSIPFVQEFQVQFNTLYGLLVFFTWGWLANMMWKWK